jgi:hypothetical protein
MANLLPPDHNAPNNHSNLSTASHTELSSLAEKEADTDTPLKRNSLSSNLDYVVDEEKANAGSASKDATLPDEEKRMYTNLRWFIVCVALYTNAFLYGMDNTIVADVQGAVIERFGEVNKLGWIGIGFSMGSVAVILPLGKAFGLFNVKWLYIASIVMFEGGSALCGAAPSMNALIFGRVWAGAGGAGMYLG